MAIIIYSLASTWFVKDRVRAFVTEAADQSEAVGFAVQWVRAVLLRLCPGRVLMAGPVNIIHIYT